MVDLSEANRDCATHRRKDRRRAPPYIRNKPSPGVRVGRGLLGAKKCEMHHTQADGDLPL